MGFNPEDLDVRFVIKIFIIAEMALKWTFVIL